MSRVVDYYFAPHSPWTYLGHERFAALAREAGATVRLIPIDLLQLFEVSGGLPLAQRPPQRQAYRLLELTRFSRHLGMPMHVEPRHFPVVPHAAARLVIAVDQADGTDAAMRLTGALLRAVWEQQRDIADDATLTALLAEQDLDAARLARSREADIAARYDANTRAAIDARLFGAPSYVIDGELFWGQDRLDFVRRALLPDPA
ncbi:2-hydroxychromene-2-carboxylate isomerase [Roseateles chitosanitabidus]|uniref:2-hydroxychromene-2-carboxylate isomerase n=1 Tax=Roseateles chitosanitabidus TaxID=65048 RepID=UPI000836C6BD|nr:2-hydroxychromene-2-carboxylate isomerase [Roseateles chitosanitabidus]MBO9686007.1 2-hydroxychromene-2-carboxylate isomerase [Roseateles chitosanitabidus]